MSQLPPSPDAGDPLKRSSGRRQDGPPVPPPRAAAPPPPRRGRSWWRRLLVVIVVLVTVILGLGLLSLVLFGPPAYVEPGSWLEIRFAAAYPEERPDRTGLQSALRPTVVSHQEALTALERVVDDERIEGVLLRAEGFPGAWAQARELRTAVQRLRDRGVRVVAHANTMTSIDYYVATSADRLSLAPEGLALVGGMQAQLTFVRGALDKVGIEVESVGVGEYKSAPEQLTAGGSSAASRSQVQDYLDDVFDTWIEAIAEARGITRERMRMLVERGLHDAAACLEQGIVDRIEDFVGLRERLGDPPTIGILDYLAASDDVGTDDVRIALIHVAGTIVPGRETSDPLAGELAGSGTIVRRLERAREDDRVRAVVLRVDSPGGSALASDLILREVDRLRRSKPVVVSMSGTAASGGYYVAMRADRILADPLSVTGSIGVFVLRPNVAGTLDELDVNVETYRRGENAALFDPTRPWTAAQRALLEETLERFYDRFVQRVAEGRGLSVEEADAAARGRVWSGQRALAAGLVDELGGRAEAIATAAELAGIDRAVRPRVVTFQPVPGPLDRMLANLLSGERSSTTVALPDELLAIGRSATRWTVLADGRPQFALPWSLRVR